MRKIVAVPESALKGEQQRRNEEPAHAAIELSVRNARIVALAELIGEGRIGQRIDQPHQHFARVGDDVAIMQGHHIAVLAGKRIAHAVPDIAPLSGLLGRKPQ